MASQERRLRSGVVMLGSVGLLAAALVSCSSGGPDKRCVDPTTYKKLNDRDCHDGGPGRYYYGGSVKNGKVSGGGFDKSAVKRGGFGGGSGGGKGGEGGHGSGGS
ncbi:hypothetical protein [Streptomyces sp. IBSBF 2435]|uniref:hypothetical protein n=1 Tax=Streptomyces sp. IBSBF 2435 TaxID=2903531 RepID=UPI002FDC13AF